MRKKSVPLVMVLALATAFAAFVATQETWEELNKQKEQTTLHPIAEEASAQEKSIVDTAPSGKPLVNDTNLNWDEFPYDHLLEAKDGILVAANETGETDEFYGRPVLAVGMCDASGGEILPCRFNSISLCPEGLAIVSEDQGYFIMEGYFYPGHSGIYGIYNTEGEQLVPCEYDYIQYQDAYFEACKDYFDYGNGLQRPYELANEILGVSARQAPAQMAATVMRFDKSNTELRKTGSGYGPDKTEYDIFDAKANLIMHASEPWSVKYVTPGGRLVIQEHQMDMGGIFFADRTGAPLNSLRFDFCFWLEDADKYIAGMDGLKGLWDGELEPLAEPVYRSIEQAWDSGGKEFIFQTEQGYGVWDAGMNVLIEPQYAQLDYHGGPLNRAATLENGKLKWGYLGPSGEIVVPLEYDWAQKTRPSDRRVHVRMDDNHFFFNAEGNPVEVPPEQAFMLIEEEKEGLVGVADLAGNILIEPECHLGSVIGTDIYMIDKKEPWERGVGALDYDYRVICPPVYDNHLAFFQRNGGKLSVCSKDRKEGVLNRNGALLLPCQYQRVFLAGTRLAIVWEEGEEIIHTEKLLWLNPDTLPGEEQTPAVLLEDCDNIQAIDGTEFLLVEKNNIFGLYNTEGACVLPIRYDAIALSGEEAALLKDGKITWAKLPSTHAQKTGNNV